MEQIEPARSGHVVIGVDTHKHIHVAAVMDSIGGILASLTISTDTAGFRQLSEWAATFGKIIAFGIEGTGSYGAGLTSFIRRNGHKVIEVSRPDRRLRRLSVTRCRCSGAVEALPGRPPIGACRVPHRRSS